MAVDEIARVLELLRDVRFRTSSGGGVGVGTEISVGSFDLRKRGIITKMGDRSNLTFGSTPGLPVFFLNLYTVIQWSLNRGRCAGNSIRFGRDFFHFVFASKNNTHATESFPFLVASWKDMPPTIERTEARR